jgi:hypothetical protein
MQIIRRDLVNVSGSAYQPTNKFMNNLREVPYLDSKRDHITAIDVDGIIRNYKTKRYMMLETKAYMQTPGYAQEQILDVMDKALKSDPNFVGTFLLQHENVGDQDRHVLKVWRDKKWKVIHKSKEWLSDDEVFHGIKAMLER